MHAWARSAWHKAHRKGGYQTKTATFNVSTEMKPDTAQCALLLAEWFWKFAEMSLCIHSESLAVRNFTPTIA